MMAVVGFGGRIYGRVYCGAMVVIGGRIYGRVYGGAMVGFVGGKVVVGGGGDLRACKRCGGGGDNCEQNLKLYGTRH